MKGTITLDRDISDQLDQMIADWISENVVRKSVIITSVTKVNERYADSKGPKVYSVEFQDVLTELAGTQAGGPSIAPPPMTATEINQKLKLVKYDEMYKQFEKWGLS